MKKVFLLMIVIFAATAGNVCGQLPGAPAGAGDSSLRDDNIRLRSIELERIKREAAKSDSASYGTVNSSIEAKFPQIKEDFESIQIAETAIVNAYRMSKNIDYKLIESSARDIEKKSKRLETNLFQYKSIPDAEEKKASDKDEKQPDIKELIIALDNALGSFVTSKIFVEKQTVDAKIAGKARTDLLNIIKISDLLNKTAAQKR